MSRAKFVLAALLLASSASAAPCYVKGSKQVLRSCRSYSTNPDAVFITIPEHDSLLAAGADSIGKRRVVFDVGTGKPRPMTAQEIAAREAEIAAMPQMVEKQQAKEHLRDIEFEGAITTLSEARDEIITLRRAVRYLMRRVAHLEPAP